MKFLNTSRLRFLGKEVKVKNQKRIKPRIIVIPHYVGTEKADDLIKKIITDEVKKKIKKSA